MSAETRTVAEEALDALEEARNWTHAWITGSTDPSPLSRLAFAYQHLVQAMGFLQEARRAEQTTIAGDEDAA